MVCVVAGALTFSLSSSLCGVAAAGAHRVELLRVWRRAAADYPI
jgi:hypothetical protein